MLCFDSFPGALPPADLLSPFGGVVSASIEFRDRNWQKGRILSRMPFAAPMLVRLPRYDQASY